MKYAFPFVVLCAAFLPCLASVHEVSGLVVDAKGQPVQGASVWIDQDRLARKTETDASGMFRFQDVKTGLAQIVAWKQGLAVGGLDAQVAGTASVSIVLGEPDKLAVRLISRSRNPETGDELPPAPVAGARMETLHVNDTFTVSVEDLTPLGFPGTRSDAEGRLVIDYLPKGGHLGFRVSHRSFADTQVPYYPVGQREIVLQMRPGLVLRGRVTNHAGKGIEHARVSIFRADQSALREFNEAITDRDGFYNATLPPGDYYVTAKHEGFATPKPVPGHLEPGATDAYCDVTMPTAYAIKGSIIGTDGAPVGGVVVQYLIDNVVYEQTLTDEKGAFRLNVATGDGRIHVVAPDGYMTDRATDIDVKMTPQDVTIDKPIQLQVLPEITGTVVDPDGKPVKDAVVMSMGLKPEAVAVTGDQGHFSIQLPRLPYQAKALFRAEHPLRFLRAIVEVSFAALKPLDLTLMPFDPDLSPCKPENVRNKQLEGLRGAPAPKISCDHWFNVPEAETSAKDTITLEKLRGKVVVLDFWGGFDQSEDSLARSRKLNALYLALRDQPDVAFVGIHDSGGDLNDIKGYIRERGIQYPVGRDENAVTYDLYDINSVPQTVLLDKKGVLRFYDVEGRLLELIKSLRREAP